jgi:uncharacterized protein
MELGQYNKLKVMRQVDFGYYLDGEDYGDILLPKKYAPENLSIDDLIDVMVYLDGEERLIATTETPIAQVGEFAKLKVCAIADHGAYLDWGLTKHLFVPHAEQHEPMELDQSYLVYIMVDERTERIMGTSKFLRFLDTAPPLIKENQKLDGIVCGITPLAYKVIFNHCNTGLLYRNEVFKKLEIGDNVTVFVKNIRPDFKVDLSLQTLEPVRFEENAELILSKLREAGGVLNITDTSSPEEIYSTFGISKKSFKKAVGNLYKAQKISLTEEGIFLIDNE